MLLLKPIFVILVFLALIWLGRRAFVVLKGQRAIDNATANLEAAQHQKSVQEIEEKATALRASIAKLKDSQKETL